MKDCTNAKVGDKVVSRDGKLEGVVLAVGLDYESPLLIAIQVDAVRRLSRPSVVFRQANGAAFSSGLEDPFDFFLAPVKKTVWIRMIRSIHHPIPFPSEAHATRREAERDAYDPSVEVLPAVEYTYEE